MGVFNNATSYVSVDLLFLIIGAVMPLIYWVLQQGKRDGRLPPGPATVPILGNVHVMPPRYAHLYFQKIAKDFSSDIISFKVFSSDVIVVNSAQATHDLLDKRSASFAERPQNWLTNEYICHGHHILLARGKYHHTLRKLWNKMLAPGVIPKYVELQEAEAKAVLYNITTNPADFYKELKRYACSLTLAMAHGKRAPTYDQHDQSGFSVADFYHYNHEFTSFLEVGGAPPLDEFPILKYMPAFLAPWKVAAKKSRADQVRFYEEILFRETLQKVKSGVFDADSCWVADLIVNNRDGLDEEALAWQGGVVMEGGSETSSGSLLTAVLAACTHPEVVQKLQAELDSVCGVDRMPNLQDIDNLPYCRAFIREIFRWRPVAPASVPHLTTKEETYKGYLIPVNSVIVQNNWAIYHDPESFDEPELFKPERFLQNEYGLKPGADNESAWRHTFTFGSGRRYCQGAALAENSLAITIPKLMWSFKFEPVGEIDVHKFVAGHITAPVPFACKMTPRTAKHRECIMQEYEASSAIYERYSPGKTSLKE